MKIEPNPAALEAMARAAYEREAEQHPVQWAVATWEQLAPNMRESWTNAAASFLQPYLDALPTAPPGADAILKILDAHKARSTGLVYCECEERFETDQAHRQHLAAMIEKGNTP